MRKTIVSGLFVAIVLSTGQVIAEPERRVFPNRTGDALVFSDGLDGVTAVDLDRRVAVRSSLHGEWGGERQLNPAPVDRSLVVWDGNSGNFVATPLDGGEPRRLGHGTLAFPSVEPGFVWLVDYPGEAIGAGQPIVRFVDTAGHLLLERAGLSPDVGPPVIAIPGGLAYQTRTGLLLWDAKTAVVTGRLGRAAVFPLDVHGNAIAWCDVCTDLHFTDIGGADVTVRVPNGSTEFAGYRGRFSPDGRRFAAIVTNHKPGTNGFSSARVVLIETGTGTIQAMPVGRSSVRDVEVAWSPDSRRLYFSSNSYMKSRTTLNEYVVATGKTRTTIVPFGGLLGFVVVSRDEVRKMLDGDIGTSDTCQPPYVYPSNRTKACAFRF